MRHFLRRLVPENQLRSNNKLSLPDLIDEMVNRLNLYMNSVTSRSKDAQATDSPPKLGLTKLLLSVPLKPRILIGFTYSCINMIFLIKFMFEICAKYGNLYKKK
jgi:hypothetical protein